MKYLINEAIKFIHDNLADKGTIFVGFSGGKDSIVTADQRKEMWDNSKNYLGKIAEIEYKEVSKFGALRMPRFKCWRWDK